MATAAQGRSRKVFWAIGLLAIAMALWLFTRGGATNGVAGTSRAQLWQGEQVMLVLSEQGDAVTLASEPIAIAKRPDWADYRRFWRERGSGELNAIMYRGEGRRIDAPGCVTTACASCEPSQLPSCEADARAGSCAPEIAAASSCLDLIVARRGEWLARCTGPTFRDGFLAVAHELCGAPASDGGIDASGDAPTD